MANVVGVKFKTAGKTYYFDPGKLDVKIGDNVIVETARGMEFGTVNMTEKEVSPAEIVSPLKKVVRIAEERDHKRHRDNIRKKDRALRLCQEKIDKHKLEMKLIDVEYTFDNNKIIFYFTADGRVDFRELVKDLASVFKMRIELRQIGVRDEAKMIGGIGTCGRSLCCHSWLTDFDPVSIKMAKAQNLSLNPAKISGICGRLMCCLKYENDVYMEFKKGMPDVGERVRTPDGMAVVVDTNILENNVKTRLILEEGSKGKERQDKLSTEFYNYKKQEIKRLGKGRKKKKQQNDLESLDGELLKEMEELLKE